jgi:hypothetical protein
MARGLHWPATMTVTRLMMAMALVGLCAVGTGCDTEPEGSCITSTFSSDSDNYGSHDVCQDHVTASACSEANGQFSENGDCTLFDLLHVLTAN